MKKKFFLLLPPLCFFVSVSAQDFNFSQFNELPILRNPALVGIFAGDIKTTAVWRNQWNKVTVPYKTQGLGTEITFPVRQTTFGVGLHAINDKAGDSRLQRVLMAGTVSAHKLVSEERKSFVSVGFTGELIRQQFQESGLRWNEQFVNGAYDPTAPSGQNFNSSDFPTLRNYGDVSAGLLFNSVFGNDVQYYFGVAGFHLLTQENNFKSRSSSPNSFRFTDSTLFKLMLNGGIAIPTSDDDKVILYTDYFWQGGARQLQAGLFYRHALLREDDDDVVAFSLGSFTRWGDAVIPMVKLDYHQFALGMTYDVNVSKLASASKGNGGFELTLAYRGKFNSRITDLKMTQCPREF